MSSFSTVSAATRRLEGKVELITGGARGIGKYTTELFVRHGTKVVIADIQDELGQSICNELGPSKASYIHCNVTIDAHVKNAVDTTVVLHGKLDIMYNNAGIVGSSKPNIRDFTLSDFEEVVRVNLIGPFLGTKHAARVMIPRQQGSIITKASTFSVEGGGSLAYTSSKHADVTKNAALELGRHGIRVNCVSPHVTPTPLSRRVLNEDDNGIAKLYSNLKGTSCKVEDTANAVLFLASDESKFISGHNLLVDGGFSVVNAGFSLFDG